ncbi:DUF805 domain-containing protein [Sulfitobacter albidus]|uniref:DUF805 domain-containing protein n=1 Tax=Sulfitobacter albidus TaxID=2829501 RepID=A0A975PLD4_9RHOB|nr:DUF805 domain-containing protein [Sulfitobacter albidus]QUJ75603.1 DUF805 domain-containing protein [Sulfitobacter albidus]
MTGPFSALNLAFTQLVKFSGRATRSEFWWVFLAYVLCVSGAAAYDAMTVMALVETYGANAVAMIDFTAFTATWVLVVFALPLLSLTVRRLHDAGFSGFWVLVNMVPGIGGLVLLALCALPGQNGTTVHGSPIGRSIAKPLRGKRADDPYAKAMQGYAVLFDQDRPVTPEMQAARKEEISDYYRSRVLKPAASA